MTKKLLWEAGVIALLVINFWLLYICLTLEVTIK